MLNMGKYKNCFLSSSFSLFKRELKNLKPSKEKFQHVKIIKKNLRRTAVYQM